MYVNPDLDKPIFIQIAEQLEDSIFTGTCWWMRRSFIKGGDLECM